LRDDALMGGIERFIDRLELGGQTIVGAVSSPAQSSADRADGIVYKDLPPHGRPSTTATFT
jgi:hypothetical protein